jgi:alpha-L-rhamnosidase
MKGRLDGERAVDPAAGLGVSGLLTEYACNPLGIDVPIPRLSWRVSSARRGQVQTAHQILVASGSRRLARGEGDVWDSGKIDSDRSVNVPYAGRPLASATRYHWKVRVWGRDGGVSAWSAAGWWETALFEGADWQAAWVGGPPAPADPLLRKVFPVTGPVRQARVYLSGLGHYELRLNGRKVGDGVLEGEVTDYTRRVGYSTYDVTSYLRTGGNAIGVMLGRGFYDVHQPTPLDWHRAPWRDRPKLLLRLEIRYADGTATAVVSDGTWHTAKGPVTFDSVYGGEDHDARREQHGWDTAAFDAARWVPARLVDAPAGRLVATITTPVTVAETLHSVRTTEPRPGVHVLDLARIITGWGRLTLTGEAGTSITLQYGQKLLADGTVDYANAWHGGRSQTDRYTTNGRGTEVWEPRFTFKSFRYIQVTGLPTPPQADTIVGRSIHSPLPVTGHFRSSNRLFNTFNDGMRRTILGTFVGYPAVDPFYEKSGWTEDVFVAAQSIMYNFDTARLFTKWLADIRDSQLPSGQIPIIIPSPGWGYTSWGTPSPTWTAVYPIMLWRMYLNYDDRQLVEDHYPHVKKYLDREITNLTDGIVTTEFLGDWIAPGYSIPPEDTRLAATAYIYRQLTIVADLAMVHDMAADARRYRESAALVRDRFNATFLNIERGRYETTTDPGYRQSSNLLPLAFGMVPPELATLVFDNLVADVRARGNHLDTGTLGTEVILPVLTDNGHTDLAHAIATQTTYPSWGYWYANGADTMWESWELGTRSRVHFFLGLVDEWLYRSVAGITAGSPGYKQIVIRPRPPEGPATVRATFRSLHGEIRSRWKRHGDTFTLEVTIPANTTALIHVPAVAPDASCGGVSSDGADFVRLEDGCAVFAAGSGSYRFTARPRR